LRKARTAIRKAGADNRGIAACRSIDLIAETGLAAQTKATKPTPRWPARKINHGSAARVWKAP
jgi:hypothetical protein